MGLLIQWMSPSKKIKHVDKKQNRIIRSEENNKWI